MMGTSFGVRAALPIPENPQWEVIQDDVTKLTKSIAGSDKAGIKDSLGSLEECIISLIVKIEGDHPIDNGEVK